MEAQKAQLELVFNPDLPHWVILRVVTLLESLHSTVGQAAPRAYLDSGVLPAGGVARS